MSTPEQSPTMYESLVELLNRKNQRFVCHDTGWPQPGPERHIAHLVHDVEPPLSEHALEQLSKQISPIPEVLEFYRRWGSVRLYCDAIRREPFGSASAFFIAPPDHWEVLRSEFADWIADLDDDERENLLPDWIDTCVVIGEIPNSGNYLLMPIQGAQRGSIHEFEHDGFEFIERGRNLAAFLDQISTVDDARIREIRSHTRYSDGSSDVQWLCQRYLFDADDA